MTPLCHFHSFCFSVPSSLLQPRHFFSSDQPVSYDLCTSFLVTLRCLSVHAWVFLRTISWIGSRHTPSFQLLTLVLCCPCLPVDHSCLFQKHLFYVLRADPSHVHLHLLPILSLLSPCLKINDLPPPSLQLPFFSHLPNKTPSAQASVVMVESSSSTSKLFNSNKRKRHRLSACCCSSPCQLVALPVLSRGPDPSSTTSSHQF